MSRTMMSTPFNGDVSVAQSIAEQVLREDGYKLISYYNEMVWKKGTGTMTAMHYIRVDYEPGMVNLQGWIQVGMGSVGGDEHDLSGSFVGVVPKRSTLKTMNRIIESLQHATSVLPSGYQTGVTIQTPQVQQPQIASQAATQQASQQAQPQPAQQTQPQVAPQAVTQQEAWQTAPQTGTPQAGAPQTNGFTSKFCSKCGNQFGDTDAFCSRCGAKRN